MNHFRADLHCHTTCSDGTLTPKEVVACAKRLRLGGLSITDHDSIESFEEASLEAAQRKIQLISGVEFSTVCRGANIHVLGYSFSPKNQAIKDLCQLHKERRALRAQAMLNLLKKEGIFLTVDEITEALPTPLLPSSIGRPHIAFALVKKEIVTSIKEAFTKYLGDKKSCYVPSTAPSTETTLQIIKNAGGIAILAHPHLIKGAQTLKAVLTMPFDGLEGHYARLPEPQCRKWLRIAAEKKWLVTGGSDFHGSTKPDIPLGGSWTNEETFNLLLKRFQENL